MFYLRYISSFETLFKKNLQKMKRMEKDEAEEVNGSRENNANTFIIV